MDSGQAATEELSTFEQAKVDAVSTFPALDKQFYGNAHNFEWPDGLQNIPERFQTLLQNLEEYVAQLKAGYGDDPMQSAALKATAKGRTREVIELERRRDEARNEYAYLYKIETGLFRKLFTDADHAKLLFLRAGKEGRDPASDAACGVLGDNVIKCLIKGCLEKHGITPPTNGQCAGM
ncbi:MAG: hypothetical protein SFX19_02520 [Alphaproteobacteria bacterium]|nr:hypothetical protein [Alphaproteobacteria bacterium]